MNVNLPLSSVAVLSMPRAHKKTARLTRWRFVVG